MFTSHRAHDDDAGPVTMAFGDGRHPLPQQRVSWMGELMRNVDAVRQLFSSDVMHDQVGPYETERKPARH